MQHSETLAGMPDARIPRKVSSCYLLLVAALWGAAEGDFSYQTFADTSGLVFRGSAATSTCGNDTLHGYQPNHGSADGTSVGQVPPSEVNTELPGFRETRTVETDDEATTAGVAKHLAAFGHRDNYSTTPKVDCATRARLTPSQPFKRGAFWRRQPVLVLRGFSTEFEWQVGEHSRSCLTVKDAAFNGNLYSSCAVHGADGFAFVLHLDPSGPRALGAGGGGVGYAGLRNAIAVEFDTSYNPELGDGAPRDHVQIQALGPDPVTADDVSRLAAAAYADVADGAVHRARVAYYPTLKEEWVSAMSVAPPARRFLVDQGEARRLGTLALWIDPPPLVTRNTSSVPYPAKPTLAIPLNLAAALHAPTAAVTVGFTSATGRSFERHDILSWTWCEQPECARSRDAARLKLGDSPGQPSGEPGPGTDHVLGLNASGIDYHRESNV